LTGVVARGDAHPTATSSSARIILEVLRMFTASKRTRASHDGVGLSYS
jgi:hypothetical protein